MEKLDLKQFAFLQSKDQIRKRNYIGDSIIAERLDEDEEHVSVAP